MSKLKREGNTIRYEITPGIMVQLYPIEKGWNLQLYNEEDTYHTDFFVPLFEAEGPTMKKCILACREYLDTMSSRLAEIADAQEE